MPRPIRKTQIPGTILGYWSGSTKALLKLEDGRILESQAPPELEERFKVGDQVVVYFDERGAVIGWLLPGMNLGLNLRLSEDT